MTHKRQQTGCVFLRIVLVVSFLFVNSIFVSGQLLIGPKIGAGIAWSDFESNEEKDFFRSQPITTYGGGVMVSMRVEKRFFLQAELIYSRKGKITKGRLDPLLESKLINHYFEFPILYRMDFKTRLADLDFKWFVGAGPNISYWWKGKGTLSSSELDEEGVNNLDYKLEIDFDPELPELNKLYVQDANRIQLGFNFALGIVFEPIKDQTIILDFRFDLGHSFLARQDFARFGVTNEYGEATNVRNNALRVSVGYLLDTKISDRKKGKSTNKGRER